MNLLQDLLFASKQAAINAAPWNKDSAPCSFVLVGGARSGSTLLQRYLASHPNVLCFHELLKTAAKTTAFNRAFLGRRKALLKLRDEDIQRFISTILCGSYPRSVHAVGFKALYDHPKEPERRELVWRSLNQLENLRVIWINRNPVARVVSFAIARQSSKWVGQRAAGNFELDPNYLLNRLRIESTWENQVKDNLASIPNLEVQYHLLAQFPENTFKSVQDFLGVSRINLEAPLSRQSTDNYRSQISNFREISVAMRDSEFEVDFNEVYGI